MKLLLTVIIGVHNNLGTVKDSRVVSRTFQPASWGDGNLSEFVLDKTKEIQTEQGGGMVLSVCHSVLP